MKVENIKIRKAGKVQHKFAFDMFFVTYDTTYTNKLKENVLMSKSEIIDLLKEHL